MSVLLTGRWGEGECEQWVALLREALPEETWVLEPGPEVEIAVVANPAPGALQGLPRLAFIQSLWAGVEKLLADDTLPAGIPLARMVDPAMNEAMPQTALWAVLGLQRGFFRMQAQQRRREWLPPVQPRAAEWCVLVLGLGELGGRVAQALVAQGYAVSGYSRGPADLPGIRCIHGEPALAAALGEADTVINLLPLTDTTRGFFDAARLAQCKRGAGLVNLARGAHVVEADLLAALASGRIGHAVLDVFQVEPLPAEHPFWCHERVTVLPHIAAQTDARSAVALVAANLRAWRAGREPAHRVERSRGY